MDRAIQIATEETEHRRTLERDAFEFSVKENTARRRTILGYLGRDLPAVASCVVAVSMLLSNMFKR